MQTLHFSLGLTACAALLAPLAGCRSADSAASRNYSGRPPVTNQIIGADDYDYYPRYEIYYSRHRNEYVTREGGWTRRIDLNGATYRMLQDGPFVPMDFHDSPEHHHDQVVQRYPREWQPSRHDDHDRREDQGKRSAG
jgi:hypothetical protein